MPPPTAGNGTTANAFAMARFRVPTVASINNNSSIGNGAKPNLVSFEASHLAQTHQELKQLQRRRAVAENNNQNEEAREPQDDDNNENQGEDEEEDEEDEDEANDDDDDMMDNNELDAQVNGSSKTRNAVPQGAANDKNQFKFGATVGGSSDASAATACGVPVIRRRNVGVPKFLRFLYQMLEVEACEIIAWSHSGTAFQIRQPDELAELILPKYFKHNKVSSFQRQLNYFGFKKWTKTQTNICTFSHPFFLRGEKDKMKLIKRKERLGPIGAPTSSAGGNIAAGGSATPADGADAVSTFSSGDANGNSVGKNATKVPPSASAKAALNNRRLRANSTVKIKGIGARELAMRRHSTGALALSAALDHPVVGGLMNRKRAGTIDLELELQAQKGMDMKDLALRQPSRAKRKSLPHVMLPPSLKDRKGNQLFTPDFSGLDGKTGHFGSFRMGPSDSLRQDASPVVPVTSEMLMQNAYHHRQQQQQQQHLHHGVGNAGSGLYQFASSSMKSDMNDSSMDMSDLSGPLQSSATWLSSSNNNCYQHAPQPQHDSGSGQKDQNLMMMMPYKFAGDGSNAGNGMPPFDGIPIIDYATNSAQLSNHPMKMHSLQQQQQHTHPHQQQQSTGGFQQHPQHGTQQKDYIDVLLESAALDDQLSSQSSSVAEPQGPGLSAVWEHHYMHAPHPHQSGPAHVSPFGLMQHHHHHPNQQPPSQQHHLHAMHQIQISAMDAMNSSNHQGQRF
uniref:HSF-type DNA-binding domain-containing protein n=1 Tax=Globisporangium ultimum (strain ATCC 200006 / CBS 805.95 / DAOM BR144) TaxID=431595 RepID=K3W9M7_GLOUD